MQSLIKNSIGKKILIAATGQLMLLFVFVHVIGNLTIYFGLLNVYAEHLHSLFIIVWLNRIWMFIALSFHVFFAVQLTLENSRAKPDAYAVTKNIRTGFAGKNMIWTGLLTGVFLIYHLLHFTIQITNPDIAASVNFDAAGLPDVTGMVISSFQNFPIMIIYVISVIALVLHLTHGIQSSLQTFGLNNERAMPRIQRTGSIMAYLILIGFASIPLIIFIGLIKG